MTDEIKTRVLVVMHPTSEYAQDVEKAILGNGALNSNIERGDYRIKTSNTGLEMVVAFSALHGYAKYEQEKAKPFKLVVIITPETDGKDDSGLRYLGSAIISILKTNPHAKILLVHGKEDLPSSMEDARVTRIKKEKFGSSNEKTKKLIQKLITESHNPVAERTMEIGGSGGSARFKKVFYAPPKRTNGVGGPLSSGRQRNRNLVG